MTQQIPKGPWKEGRVAAASLCYAAPRSDQLDLIAANHAAVGIRATLESGANEVPALFAERNWHLATAKAAGVGEGSMSPPGVPLPSPLICRVAPSDGRQIIASIEETVPSGLWTIWRIEPAVLDEMGPHGHATLLKRLGDQHARIWCAPVRDIAEWHAQATRALQEQ